MSGEIDLDILGMGAAQPIVRLHPVAVPVRDTETANQNARLTAMVSMPPAAAASDAQGRDLINQLLGQAQAADAIRQISQTIGVSKLAYVKESKLYRALKGMAAPNTFGVVLQGTWEEFCGLLGISDEKANQDIANLRAFGEQALDQMQRIGIGYRELRQYRKLPDDERLALIEAAKAGDKEGLIDLAESIIVRHAKEKEALQQQAVVLVNDAQEERQRANRLEVQLEAKEDLIDTLKAAQVVNPSYSMETNVVRQQTALLDSHCAAALDELGTMANALSDEAGLPEGEFQARFHSLWFSSQSVLARAMLLIERLREMGDGFIPESVEDFKAGLFTADEANHFLAELSLLRTTLASRHTNIKTAAQDAAPRKAGRPKGSPNKAKE